MLLRCSSWRIRRLASVRWLKAETIPRRSSPLHQSLLKAPYNERTIFSSTWFDPSYNVDNAQPILLHGQEGRREYVPVYSYTRPAIVKMKNLHVRGLGCFAEVDGSVRGVPKVHTLITTDEVNDSLQSIEDGDVIALALKWKPCGGKIGLIQIATPSDIFLIPMTKKVTNWHSGTVD